LQSKKQSLEIYKSLIKVSDISRGTTKKRKIEEGYSFSFSLNVANYYALIKLFYQKTVSVLT